MMTRGVIYLKKMMTYFMNGPLEDLPYTPPLICMLNTDIKKHVFDQCILLLWQLAFLRMWASINNVDKHSKGERGLVKFQRY